jgi:hypothetical protein
MRWKNGHDWFISKDLEENAVTYFRVQCTFPRFCEKKKNMKEMNQNSQ